MMHSNITKIARLIMGTTKMNGVNTDLLFLKSKPDHIKKSFWGTSKAVVDILFNSIINIIFFAPIIFHSILEN